MSNDRELTIGEKMQALMFLAGSVIALEILRRPEIVSKICGAPLKNLGLSARLANALRRHGKVTSVEEALDIFNNEVYVPYVGKKGREELGDKLREKGYISE